MISPNFPAFSRCFPPRDRVFFPRQGGVHIMAAGELAPALLGGAL